MNNESEKMNQSQRILNAAFKCISRNGYANISLRDIADEAGVVLSQLNYYYKNKEGLFIEVVKMLGQQYLSEIEGKLKKEESDSDKISSLIKHFQEMLREKPELFKILFDLTSMALWSASLKKLLNNLYSDLTNLIEKYVMKNFNFKEASLSCSPKILSRTILGALLGTSVQVMLANDDENIADSLDIMQLLFQYRTI